MSHHEEIFKNVIVRYDRITSYLYIDDADTDEQLAIFHVLEEH